MQQWLKPQPTHPTFTQSGSICSIYGGMQSQKEQQQYAWCHPPQTTPKQFSHQISQTTHWHIEVDLKMYYKDPTNLGVL